MNVTDTLSRPAFTKWLAPLCVAFVLLASAFRENRDHPIAFWNDVLMDYPGLSLAHALNIDWWLSESSFINGRVVTFDNTMHPGFPFQVCSWIGYRLAATAAAPTAQARCENTFADPSSFWRTTKFIALSIGLLFACLYAGLAWKHGPLYSIAVGLFYFCYEGSWDYSIRLLSNETFALPLGLAVTLAAARSLRTKGETPELVMWAMWGAACALCWLNKMNYIAWTVASIPAWAFYFFTRRPSFRVFSLQIAAYILGFAATASLLVKLLLGAGGLHKILLLHWGVMTHSGHFGAGSSEVISNSAIWDALKALSAFWPFLMLSGVICLVALWTLRTLLKSGKAVTTNAALIVYLLAAAGIFFASVVKHYGPHYLVAGIPAVSLLLPIVGEYLSPRARLRLAVAVGLVFISSYWSYASKAETRYRHEVEVEQDLARLDRLPHAEGDAVLWTYRLPVRRFCLELLRGYAGIPKVSEIIRTTYSGNDVVLYPWDQNVRVGSDQVPFEKARWRYAVFDKAWFVEFPPATTQFFEERCVRVVDEPSLWVFERKAP